MKYKVTNPTYSYSKGRATFSGTFQILDDADNVLWEASISRRIGLIESSDWYPDFKEKLLADAQEIVDKYKAIMAMLEEKTGKSSVDDIVADVVSHVEGGIV